MTKFDKDFEVILVIVYARYHSRGINNWFYTREEYRAKLDFFWTMEDQLKSFRNQWLLKFDRIIAIRHEFNRVNKSRNHHNRCCEIVLDDEIIDF